MQRWLLIAAFVCCALLPVAAWGDDAALELFEKKIRPVLVAQCYECHSAESKKVKGGLLLDSRDATRKGGDSGPAIVPGNLKESLLIQAIEYSGDFHDMPPKGKLPDAVIEDFRQWVKLGAADPRDAAGVAKSGTSWEEALRTRRVWWSLQPVKSPAMPEVRDAAWAEQPIDRLVLAQLEAHQLAPAGSADRTTLIRRLSLVLTGLPPTPAEVEAFVNDPSPSAYGQLVGRLLDSPQFGERWARHWLDIVRFTETHGNEWNYEVHHAWRYRDYLIRALNQDVPYDRLVREHIAGDLLAPRWNDAEGINESPIGTAFLRFGEVNHDDCIEFRQIGFDIADNQIDTLTKAFQATTVACARCHDHKLDAVSLKDYYGLLGIFRNSRLVSHTIDRPDLNDAPKTRLRNLKPAIRMALAARWLQEIPQVGKYLLAAEAARTKRADAADLTQGLDPKRIEKWVAALDVKQPPLEAPLAPWLSMAAANAPDAAAFAEAWRKLTESYAQQDRERTEFNQSNFTTFADFQTGSAPWRITGHTLGDGTARSGEFAILPSGESIVQSVWPAGRFTSVLSSKLNATLRSPVLPRGKQRISFQVAGGGAAAVRLVSNNCQLNYNNYRALASDNFKWVSFSPAADTDMLQMYAELMTRFDNPKFPDQLGTLGGAPSNDRQPWEVAAADPRSYFGVTRVVLHDCKEAPQEELGHLRPLFASGELTSPAELATRYATVLAAAIERWGADHATDEDARWLHWLVGQGLIDNSVQQTPQLAELVAGYREIEASIAVPRITPGVGEGDGSYEQSVLVRGDATKYGDAAPRKYLEVLARPGDSFTPTGSGRLELAGEIASANNPLTARVMVNRIWHHLFGTGLARTVDDFGHMGEPPTHPELLDYLAAQFVHEGWSIKRLIRAIVLTRTFQMSSRPAAGTQEIDPTNQWLHHYPARRMEAEAIRDSILLVSGRLDRTLYGPSIQPYREKENQDRRLFPGPLDGAGRRSVYIKANLMEGPKFLGVFNFPGGKVSQGRRDITNVPAQALALMNDPFVLAQAKLWGERLATENHASVAVRIDAMFVTALGRLPRDAERAAFEQMAGSLAELHGAPAAGVLKSAAVWQDIAHTMFNLKEFIYIP